MAGILNHKPKILSSGPTLYTPDSSSQSQKSTGPSLYTPEEGPILGPTFYTPEGPDTSRRIPRQPEPQPEILTPSEVTHIHHHYGKPNQKSPRPTSNGKRNAKSQKDEEFEQLASAALVLGGGAIAGALFGQALNNSTHGQVIE